MQPIDPLPPPPPQAPSVPKLTPEAAAALLMRAPEEPAWSVALVRAFSVFLVGAALGFAVCAMFGPMDLASTADQPGRASLMEMWVKFGLPVVGLLSIGHAARARSDRPGTVLLANAIMVMVSVGLIWKLYPQSRAQAVAVNASRMQQIDIVESALSVSGNDLALQIERARLRQGVDEFLETLTKRNGMLRHKAPLPAGAVEALRAAAAEGQPRSCPDCLALIRARVLLEDSAPGTLGSTFALCPDAPCREQFAQLIIAGGGARFCLATVERNTVLDFDLAPLRRIAAGGDVGIAPETQSQVARWLAAHPEGDCPAPRPTPPPEFPPGIGTETDPAQ